MCVCVCVQLSPWYDNGLRVLVSTGVWPVAKPQNPLRRRDDWALSTLDGADNVLSVLGRDAVLFVAVTITRRHELLGPAREPRHVSLDHVDGNNRHRPAAGDKDLLPLWKTHTSSTVSLNGYWKGQLKRALLKFGEGMCASACAQRDWDDDTGLIEETLLQAQRNLDTTLAAWSEAESEYNSFVSAARALKTVGIAGRFSALTRRELWDREPGFVQWVLKEQAITSEFKYLQKWLLRASKLDTERRRLSRPMHDAKCFADALGLKPTALLRASTARGQLCELSPDSLDCVVRSLAGLGTYLRLASTCKDISLALRSMRVEHVVALGIPTTATGPCYRRVERVLRVPRSLHPITNATKLTEVGRLVEGGLNRRLKALAAQMEEGVANHKLARANLRRATTAVEYTACGDERLTKAACRAREALTAVVGTTSAFTELSAKHALVFTYMPKAHIRCEDTMQDWLRFMRLLLQ